MTGEIPDTNDFQVALSHNKPGSALRILREQKGIALEQITQQSLIPQRKLEDLEQDKYDELGGATFVHGYLRKYAKLLDVDSDPFVDALTGTLGATATTGSVSGETSAKTAYKSNKRSPGLNLINRIPGPVAVAVLLLVWGGVVLFLGEDNSREAPVAEPSQASIPETQEAHETDTVAATPRSSVAVPQAVVTPTPEPIIATPAPTAIPSAAPTPLPAVTVEPEGDGEDLLFVTFSDDCWVEVSDATGKVVFAQLKLKGDNLQLFGEAPFEVMLGNARAAEMLLNGTPVAIKPVPNRKTLRFTVAP